MAARLKKGPWIFYVYLLTSGSGEAVYVGKGSGHRLHVQRRNFGLSGYEVARFMREKDAYYFERVLIAELKPSLNRHPGGNGSTVSLPPPIPRSEFDIRFDREYDFLGGRRFCAKFLLGLDLSLYNPVSEVDGIRNRLQAVLDGPRC